MEELQRVRENPARVWTRDDAPADLSVQMIFETVVELVRRLERLEESVGRLEESMGRLEGFERRLARLEKKAQVGNVKEKGKSSNGS